MKANGSNGHCSSYVAYTAISLHMYALYSNSPSVLQLHWSSALERLAGHEMLVCGLVAKCSISLCVFCINQYHIAGSEKLITFDEAWWDEYWNPKSLPKPMCIHATAAKEQGTKTVERNHTSTSPSLERPAGSQKPTGGWTPSSLQKDLYPTCRIILDHLQELSNPLNFQTSPESHHSNFN